MANRNYLLAIAHYPLSESQPTIVPTLHSWDLSPAEAAALQAELAGRVDVRTPLGRYELVAGADIAYALGSNLLHAAVVVWRATDGAIVEKQGVTREATFPYIPGLFSFREAPALLEAFARLHTIPDVVMVDGQGRAHPRRFGLACHLGLCLQLPCLGCAKSGLYGQYTDPESTAGALASMTEGGDLIGQVLRTRAGGKPVYVSAGHLIDLASAVRVVLETCRGFRLPEPARQAHLHANDLRRGPAC
jgi:deoxyribonuclease V